ncbi:MAG: MAPEG family protein [Sterolibacterium sp.]|jgi:uncharacterized MAPEG superfamily protein
MTFAFWCILAATVLPYVWGTLSKASKRYDNSQPRLQQKTGWRQRADWAQQNSWEAFGPFAAAVLMAHWLHVAQPTIDLLAGLFILCRIAYGVAYIMNLATLRSLIWTGGVVCVLGLYVAAATAA